MNYDYVEELKWAAGHISENFENYIEQIDDEDFSEIEVTVRLSPKYGTAIDVGKIKTGREMTVRKDV